MDSPAKVIAAFLGVFVAGAVFGGFFTVGVGSRWLKHEEQAVATPAPTPAPTPAAATPKDKSAQRPALLQVPQAWQSAQLMRRYAERLDLTPEQKDRIMPMFQRATEDYRRAQQNAVRETAIILQRLQQDLAKELTPDQREKLARIEEHQRETLQKMEQKQRELKLEQQKQQQQKKAEPKKGGAKAKAAPAAAPAMSTESATTGATTSGATSTGGSTAATATTSTATTPAAAGPQP